MRLRTTFVALAITTVVVLGCTGAPAPAATSSPASPPSAGVVTSTPAASASPRPTRAPSVAPLTWGPSLGQWGPILGQKPTVGAFAFFGDPEYDANVLVVQENGLTVGYVYVDAHSAADWSFDVSGPDGLLRIATDFVEIMRVDRTTSNPAGTFTPMPATEVAVGSTRGFRYGFAWKDQVGSLERSVRYVAAIPGGFATVSADTPQNDVGRSAFADDATLVRFLPVLDQIVAGLRWPAELD